MAIKEFLKRSSFIELLGYAGLLPFALALVMATLGVLEGVRLFEAYSAMILAFMAGSCWGVAQSHHERAGYVTPAVAIAVFLWALAAWWFIGWLGQQVALIGLLAGYVALFVLEQRELFRQAYSASYKRLRRNLTLIVSGFHLVMLLVLGNGV